MKIGIFDSGIGGTTIMNAIKSELRTADYFYLADSKNCPYGEKSDTELLRIVIKNVDTLKAWGAQIIVVACNTATVKCIKKLRQKYPEISFVGTEPAIKLAASTNAKNILVLATPGTVQSERAHQLKNTYQKPNQNILLVPCPGLADTIENTVQLTPDYQPIPLTKAARALIDTKLSSLFEDITFSPDIIVLGCTHYSLIKKEIQKFFKNSIIIDGNTGVAHRVAGIYRSLK